MAARQLAPTGREDAAHLGDPRLGQEAAPAEGPRPRAPRQQARVERARRPEGANEGRRGLVFFFVVRLLWLAPSSRSRWSSSSSSFVTLRHPSSSSSFVTLVLPSPPRFRRRRRPRCSAAPPSLSLSLSFSPLSPPAEAHGPRLEKIYKFRLNKKVVRLGLRHALSVKARHGQLHIVDSLVAPTHKTKALAAEVGRAVARSRGWAVGCSVVRSRVKRRTHNEGGRSGGRSGGHSGRSVVRA